MSVFQKMLDTTIDSFKSVGRGLKNYSRRGALHAVGFEPVRLSPDGNEIWRWGGKGVEFQAPGPGGIPRPPMPASQYDQGLGMMGAAWGGFSLLGTGSLLASGFASNGIGGAVEAFSWEMGVGAALAKYGYNYSTNAAGIKSVVEPAGRFGSIRRQGRMMLRTLVGGAMGHTAGAAIGGVPGYLAAAGAGYLGVKHAGKIAMTAAAIGTGRMVASGTGSVLRAGYRYQQSKLDVQTSGSLAAFHTQAGHTMRQRAVSAIHKSHINARSALGQEANFMHYPSRNYHSRYRT